jgi:hypothetical protein
VQWRRFLTVTRAHLSGAVESYMMYDFLPVKRRDDDLFLVEYPKSGVTWLTFLIANVNALASEDQRRVTFFNVNDFVPDVQSVRHLGVPLLRVPGFRCFKSHSPYTWRYRKVFYLVRDPRHVMVSYWVFLRDLGRWRGTLEQLVRHPQFGIRAWNSHVSGWLNRVDFGACFSIIRYEDLLTDTAGELKRLYHLLGLPVSDEILAVAVERSSLENMRAEEAVFNAGHPALQNQGFVRPGQSGGPRQTLSEELCRLIEEQAASVMQRLGYARSST